MSSCRFCKNYDTGDDYDPIISADIDLGICGNMDVDVAIGYDSPTLTLFACLDAGGSTVEKKVEIHYCPICGRELGGENEISSN